MAVDSGRAGITDGGALQGSVQAAPALKIRVGALALGLAAVGLAALAIPAGSNPAAATARVLAVAIPVAFGLFRLARDRSDRFALLLLGAGALLSVTTLGHSSNSTLYSVGRVSVWALEPVLVLLILTFPHGRLGTPLERRLAAAVGLLAATLYIPTALLAPFPVPSPWADCGTNCPADAFLLSPHTAGVIDNLIRPAREVLTVLLFSGATLLVAARMRRSAELMQRVLAPVVIVAAVRVLALAVYFVARTDGQTSAFADALGWLYVLSLPLLTLAFAVGLLMHRLFVADALERLAGTLSSRPSPREIRTALAQSLRDPSLEVLYWLPGPVGGWVGDAGAPAQPPLAGPGRTVTAVGANGRQLAAIVHDEELAQDPALLDALRSYVGAALENRSLVRELRSSLVELSESRARIVTIADEERRKIERDLHDGAQQRLVALQIKLELLAERFDADSPEDAKRVRRFEDEVAATLDDVRSFGRGLYPALLADRGLSDALRAVARSAPIPMSLDVRLPHRYAREVESAVYFACIEALQNATKHARGATLIRISISGNGRLRFDIRDDGEGFDPETTPRGAGLTNLRDRIGALGGVIEIASERGRGTRVTGMVPIP